MHKKRVLLIALCIAASLFVLMEGPSLALRALGLKRQGKVTAVLAEAVTPTKEAAGGQPLDDITIACDGCKDGTYAVRDMWIKEATGQLDDEGQPEYRLVFDEAGFNRFFQTWLAPNLRDMPYRNIWFEARDGGMIVYAEVNSNPSGDFNLPSGVSYLGVRLDYCSQQGVGVDEVLSLSPADEAGLKAGDIIRTVDGVPVSPANSVQKEIQQHASGDIASLNILRGEQEMTVEVELGEWSEDARWRYVGLVLAPDVTTSRLVPIGLSLGDDLYSLPQTGLLADAVADTERMLDNLMERLTIVGPLVGEARVAWLGLAEDSFTIVMR